MGLSFAGPRDQNRLSVAFRLILALPQFAWTMVLYLVTVVVLAFGWLAALVTGRLPEGIRHFVGRTFNQYIGVQAYAVFLMTDRYPPFWPRGDYDVEVELHPATRLHRLAVLFRLILSVPALILLNVLLTGVYVVMLFVWLVVLVSGRQPRPVFEATAAMLRYLTRSSAYVLLLSPSQPRGLLGDEARGQEGDVQFDAVPAGRPRITRLVLSRTAKQLVVLTMVIGAVSIIGVQVSGVLNVRQAQHAHAGLDASYVQLSTASQAFGLQAESCGASSDPACMSNAIAVYAPAVQRFVDDLRGLGLPQYALGQAQAVEQAGQDLLNDLQALSFAQTDSEFVAAAQRFQTDAYAFDAAYGRLVSVLALG